jgi:hypothetical protein
MPAKPSPHGCIPPVIEKRQQRLSFHSPLHFITAPVSPSWIQSIVCLEIKILPVTAADCIA